MEHLGTSWNILEQVGTYWNLLEHFGTVWHILEQVSLKAKGHKWVNRAFQPIRMALPTISPDHIFSQSQCHEEKWVTQGNSHKGKMKNESLTFSANQNGAAHHVR